MVILRSPNHHNMPISNEKKIQSLQQQLEELKVVYEELLTNTKEPKSIKEIKSQIVQVEKAIRELSSI